MRTYQTSYDELGRKIETPIDDKRIAVEASFNGTTYRLNGVSRGEMPARRRNFASYAELIEAVEKANPGYEIR